MVDLSRELSKKGVDTAAIATKVIKNPKLIHELIEGVTAPKGTLRYGFEKVLRHISEERPDLLYPYFEIFEEQLENKNSFMTWGAILTIANLTAVDSDSIPSRIRDLLWRSSRDSSITHEIPWSRKQVNLSNAIKYDLQHTA